MRLVARRPWASSPRPSLPAVGLFLLGLLTSGIGVTSADSVSRLLAGPYPDLLAAVEAVRQVEDSLQRVGILHDPDADAYLVLLEESADPVRILSAQRVAARAGLRDLRILLAVADSPSAIPVGSVTVTSFNDRDEAIREASRARERGELAEVTPVRLEIGLTSVQLTGYSRRADAQRVARSLEAAGIEYRIFSYTHEREFSVEAGAFRDASRARAQAQRLAELGHRDARLVPLRGQVERYELVSVSREAFPGPAPGVIAMPPARRTPDDGTGVLVLGAQPDPLPVFAVPAQTSGDPRAGFDQLRAEAGVLPDNRARADGSHYLHASLRAEWRLNDDWSARLAARIDSYIQTGEDDFESTVGDYGESYVRYRASQRRVTLGTQTVLWGRMDDHAPTDRLSVQDVSRFVLDDLADRRRAVLAARWEEFVGEYKVDMQVLPLFRPAELPRRDSIWSPVDRSRGRIIGMPEHALMQPLIQDGRFADYDDHAWGGWGIRVSRAGRGLDYAFTVQHSRHSLPYYELDPAVRSALLADSSDISGALAAARDTFTARHPRSWVLGGDVGFSVDRATWRFEAAWLSDQPATTEDLRFITLEALDWAAGVEFFPGDSELRVNLQLRGLHLFTDEDLLDRKNINTLFGDVEDTFLRNRWRARLRFSLGLDQRDVYANPELAFIAWEPHEIYAGYHYFDGAYNTLGGFHRHHDLFTVGWRARY